MKKIFITTLLVLGVRCLACGQVEIARLARQKIELKLMDVIEITFTNTDSRRGPLVNLAFRSVKDYFEGVESDPQTLKVRSNRGFTVSVRTASAVMTYSGRAANRNSATTALDIRVPANKTGGAIAAPFSNDAYNKISQQDKMLLDDCNSGNNQSFSIQYKAKPETAYAPGVYSVDVIYTASRN